MRDDLLDAQASIDWAVTHVPCMEKRFATWAATRPYEVLMEDDAQTGEKMMVAYIRKPLSTLVIGDVAAIIHSIRSSLDMLAAALARRNGKHPKSYMHFPIRSTHADLLGALMEIEGKKWLTKAEIAKVEALKPYRGGNTPLWHLHQLDIVGKHERLIGADVVPNSFWMSMYIAGSRQVWERADDKTVLLRCPGSAAFMPNEGNTNLTLDITVTEPRLSLSHAPVRPMLRVFAEAASEAIGAFDGP